MVSSWLDLRGITSISERNKSSITRKFRRLVDVFCTCWIEIHGRDGCWVNKSDSWKILWSLGTWRTTDSTRHPSRPGLDDEKRISDSQESTFAKLIIWALDMRYCMHEIIWIPYQIWIPGNESKSDPGNPNSRNTHSCLQEIIFYWKLWKVKKRCCLNFQLQRRHVSDYQLQRRHGSEYSSWIFLVFFLMGFSKDFTWSFTGL